MKPQWDTLIKEYKDHPTVVVADVDCTGAGKSLCDEHGVQGFPTLKWGDPDDLQEYNGPRDLVALRIFAKDMKPQCSPTKRDTCTPEKIKQMDEFVALGPEKRAAIIKEKTDQIEALEEKNKAFLKELQQKYTEGNAKKEADIEALNLKELSWLKVIKALAAKKA